MRSNFLRVVLVCMILGLTAFSYAQFSPRNDYIWARSTAGGTITLDGALNEAEWAKAELLIIQYGQNAGDPTSGWNIEGGISPTDPVYATVKFLADPTINKLYLGFTVNDSSVGGKDWAQFDQILMSVKSRTHLHEYGGFYMPKEIFAGWGWDATPGFVPTFDNNFASVRYTVQGTSNDDSSPDQGYTAEFEITLDTLGYNANAPSGDVVELNFSIWDCDWNWPNDPAKFSSSKTWWQNAWNSLEKNIARVFVDPAVTINTVTTLAEPEPDVTIMNGTLFPTPAIDGNLNDAVWSNLPSFDVHFGDPALRATYPSIGKWRSGEWQGGNYPNPVVDPGNAEVKWYFKGDMLYVGVDVEDELVQTGASDEWLDGIQLSVTIPGERNGDNTMKSVRYGVSVDNTSPTGSSAIWDLTDLVATGGATFGLTLKGATTTDDPNDIDEGYMIELAIDLTRLGYSAGSPEKTVLLGFSYIDGDKFTNSANDYGTRSWWFREWPWSCAPAWCLLDDNDVVPNPAQNYATRNDYIWARSADGGTMTLDGVLDESAWVKAESLHLNYGENAGDPTSGWNIEGGIAPTDPTHAVVKFLTDPATNKLYLGFTVQDSSVGGRDWAQFDQIILSVKSRLHLHERGGFYMPKEIFAGWGWDATPGAIPTFDNAFSSARFTVQGTSNNDTITDVGYTVEVMILLDSLGYNANNVNGDVVELNFSIWDADWNWPNDPARFSSSKTWWQNAWNSLEKNVARIFVNPSVTINTTTTLAEPEPDVVIPNGGDHPTVTVDGNLNEGIWNNLSSFDVHFGDPALRATYPSIGKWRSGEFQGGNYPNPVIDPGNAKVKWFFKGDKLYIGVDVDDELVQSNSSDDWADGIQVSVTIPDERNGDYTMKSVRYGVRIDSLSLGGSAAIWDLTEMVDSSKAWYGVQLKGATTIDDPNDIDEGYMVELCIDLTQIGYEAGSPDKMVLLGFSYLDGDKFTNSANDYGTRAWWFREWPWNCAPAWCLLDNNVKVSGATTAVIAMNDKWNLVSIPVTVGDYTKTTLFPTATTNAFAYVGGYTIVSTLEDGVGYWLKFSGNQNVSMNGTVKTTDTITVSAGWNLIGSISYPVPVTSIFSIPSGLVTSNFFGFATGYNVATDIEPGKGYWVKVNGSGKLLLSTSPGLAANKIKIVPTSELPPAPPSELNEDNSGVPAVFAVYQNYPNPFNPATVIHFSIPQSERVTLKVFDLLGREVMTLLNNEELSSGEHMVRFNGSNLTSGLYYYRVQAGTNVDVKKMILAK